MSLLHFNEEVYAARENGSAIVALESTVIAHGLPYPENLNTAIHLESVVREEGAVPATIAVFEGRPHIGLSNEEIERLARSDSIPKASAAGLVDAIASKGDRATTVSATMAIARLAGIDTVATGGIGGVHRENPHDISADLPELAENPMTVVCSGPKSILDIRATREWLETHGVIVVGFGCDEMPAFYHTESGVKVDARVDTPEEVAEICLARDSLKRQSSVLVTVPVPRSAAISAEEFEDWCSEADSLAQSESVSGAALTPFLLSRIFERSEGRTLEANVALLLNNARVAARIAIELNRARRKSVF